MTPLHRLYTTFRNQRGGQEQQFHLLKDLLQRVGMPAHVFLGELFKRSVAQFSHYSNANEAFAPAAARRKSKFARNDFAVRLIDAFRYKKVAFDHCPDVAVHFVDYEVNPNRTTLSCYEDGSSGETSGGGGMDFLLCSNGKPSTPAVAEVKAQTESVGPTFALVQGLKYLAELAPPSQWARLAHSYPDVFKDRFEVEPTARLDLYLIFEDQQPGAPGDFQFMQTLSRDLLSVTDVSAIVRRIVCLHGEEIGDRVMFHRLLP